MKKLILCLFLPLLLTTALADEDPVWALVAKDGSCLTHVCYEPEVGDEYIAADNHRYKIVQVEEERAMVEEAGIIPLPDVSWLDADTAQPVSAMAGKSMAFYCTHSDESYEPSDGTYSDEKRGSIYQVAKALAEVLEESGVETQVSDALHYPHDAGAYRRSRQTAVQLLKSMPNAIFDIHRDGIPDPDEYAVSIGGKACSKVRLLVGRGNQNMDVNKSFALKIKAVADKVYPGLIKDIYLGKGTYNQDLAPNSILLECGTYTLSKERVMESMPMLGNVLYRTMYGGITGSAGVSDTGGISNHKGEITQGQPDPSNSEGEKGAGKGILWLLILGVAALIVFAVISTGSIKGGVKKAGRNISEMTGGLLGKRPEDGEK